MIDHGGGTNGGGAPRLISLEWLGAEHEAARLAAAQESLPSLRGAFYWCTDPYAADDNRRWLLAADAARQRMQAFVFAVMRTDRGTFVGEAALDELDNEGGSANLSYWIRAADRGQGFASEAAAAVARFAFDELGLRRLRVSCIADNAASLRVINRLGTVAVVPAAVGAETTSPTSPALEFLLEAEHWPHRLRAGQGF